MRTASLNILIADDDADDRFLFGIALNEMSFPYRLTSVNNGEQLMRHLASNEMPDVLVLDLNMPLKNGNECLLEIRRQEKFKHLPIIIYSTSLQEEVADVLYKNGAHYYIQKTDIDALVPYLKHVLHKIINGDKTRPDRDKFILNLKPARTGRYF